MRRHSLFAFFLIMGMIITSAEMIHAQSPWYDNVRRQPMPRRPQQLFMYETAILPHSNPDSVEFHLFTRVANDVLQFVFNDTVYSAGYEIILAIKDASDNSIVGSIKRKTIFSQTYDETNDRNQFTKEHFRFILPADELSMYIELLDRESKKPITAEQSIEIPDFYSESLAVTKMLFYRDLKNELKKIRDMHPIYPAVRSMTDSLFGSFFYIVHDGSLENVHLAWTIKNHDGEPVDSSAVVLTLNSEVQPVWIDLGKSFPFGQYELSIDVKSGSLKKHFENFFTIRWSTHSILLTDLKQAVETLQYLMRNKEWAILNELPAKEQEEMIEAFWKERDPEPETPENELEEEYYQRVAFANENFFTWPDGSDGWRSDRGRIYILFGPPSEVERPSSGATSRYEIWYYRNFQRRFVFLDRHGGGDFRLISE